MNIQTLSRTRGQLIGEPSFADAIAAIKMGDLDEKTKRYWTSGLKKLAEYLGEPVETVPARIAALTPRVRQLHPERLNVHRKTFANTRALAKGALQWFNRLTLGSARRAPMAAEFRQVWSKITDRYAKDMLSPFFRFLTGLKVPSSGITDEHIASYAQYRREAGFYPLKRHQIRQLVRHWEECRRTVSGWPAIKLTEPTRLASSRGPSWEEFPLQLRNDIDAYCESLSQEREDDRGRILYPCSDNTIALRRRMLVAAVRMAARNGVSLGAIDSLSALVEPSLVKAILDAYWKQNGKVPKIYTIDLASKLLTVARSHVSLAPEAIIKLGRICQTLERHRKKGLTPKNREVVRHALQDGSWAKVVKLPQKLRAIADARRKTSPVTSAVLAQMAVAIRILAVAPVRVENLGAIKIGENLVRPGGPGSTYSLTFEHFDVKNDISLAFELDQVTSEIIDEYISCHRPQLMRGRSHSFLIPGTRGDKKQTQTFGEQISRCLWKHLGIALTPHQFRHCAAAFVLRDDPGNYKLVQDVLAHKRLETTVAFYIGLETIAATRHFGKLVTGLDD